MTCKSLVTVLLLFGWTCAPVSAQFLGKNTEEWLKDLDKGNDSARRGAAFALGKLKAEAAVAPLRNSLLADKDVWVREASAFALGEIGKSIQNNQLLPVLKTALAKDKSPKVRRSAAFALGCLGPNAAPALPDLQAALKDDSALVRQSAAWALAKLGPPAIAGIKLALQDADSLVKRDAASSMEQCIPASNSNPPDEEALRTFIPLPVEVVRPLLPDLAGLCRDDSSEVRRAALGVLIKIVNYDDGKYIRDVAPALKDEDEEVRNYAALVLGNIGSKDAAVAVPQLLITLRKQGSIELRQQAAICFSNIGPEAKLAVPDLIAALKDKDQGLRYCGTLALAGIAEEAHDAYDALLERAEDDKEHIKIRIEAAYALSRLGKCKEAVKAVPRVLKVMGDPKEPITLRTRITWALYVHYIDELRKLGLYPTLYKILAEGKVVDKDNNDNRMLRYESAMLLGRMQRSDVQPEVLQTLLEFLRDTSKIEIHVGKVSSVGGVGKETGVGGTDVKEATKSDSDARVLAVQTLKEIGRDRLINQVEIIAELRKLATGKDTNADLRVLSQRLLKELSVDVTK